MSRNYKLADTSENKNDEVTVSNDEHLTTLYLTYTCPFIIVKSTFITLICTIKAGYILSGIAKQMKAILKYLDRTLLATDAWTFFAVILCISLVQTENALTPDWDVYLRHLFFFTVLYFPILLYQVYKYKLKASVSRLNYNLIWLSLFVVYLTVATWIGENRLTNYYQINGALQVSMSLLAIEGALAFNALTTQYTFKTRWLKKISFDHAILFTLLLIAMLFAAMATTDLNLFYTSQLIKWQINPATVLKHFGTFLSLTFQLFLTYCSIYILYFINKAFLIPKLLKPKGILFYVIGLLGSVALFYPILAQLILLLPLSQVVPLLPGENSNIFDGDNGEGAITVMVLSIPLVLAMQWLRQHTEIVSLQKQQVQTELDLLKQQLDPHFFFNTLNNLYSLSRRKSDQTSDVILQLSEMMRYLIYKGKEEKVLLAQEVKYVEDYLQLQLIRVHKKVNVQFEKSIADPDVLIPPLMLIIFVENAFKHGIEPAENDGFLNLSIHSDDNKLTFECQNSFEEKAAHASGIGLTNLKRRLELLLPNRHELIFDETQHVYKACLTLHLS